MSNRKKTVVVEKDGVTAEATVESFKGLVKRGWTVKDDGTKAEKQEAEALAKAAAELEQQEVELFQLETDTEEKN